MDGTGEAIDLRERGALGIEHPQLTSLQIAARHPRHLFQELQVATLYIRHVGLVQNLDQARFRACSVDRYAHDQQVGGVVGDLLTIRSSQTGLGRHEHAARCRHQ